MFSVSGATLSSGSGIDVQTTVSQMVYAAQAPERIWQSQQKKLQTEANAFNQLNNELSSLSTAVDALRDPAGSFAAMSANSSQASAISASASAGTAAGTHLVSVQNLASVATAYSDSVATADTQLSDDSFSFQVGTGAVQTVTIANNRNTLRTLADYINTQFSGVTATVVNDANGARLALVSKTPGSDGDLTVSSGTAFHMNKGAKGVDASLTVDGIPVTSSSNTVVDVVPGVTFTLLAPTTSPASITVTPDTGAATQAIDDFVTAFNAVISDLDGQFKYNQATQQSGALAANSSARMVQQQLFDLLNYSGKGAITRLAQLGISMADDGTLSIDDATLSDQLKNHFADVQTFLKGNDGHSGFSNSFAAQVETLTSPSKGAFYVELKGNQTTQENLTEQIDDFEVYIDAQRQSWTEYYNRLNVLLEQMSSSVLDAQSQLASLTSTGNSTS